MASSVSVGLPPPTAQGEGVLTMSAGGQNTRENGIENESESEDYLSNLSDLNTLSDPSSDMSIPNVRPAEKDGSVDAAVDASTEGGSTARPVFKMRRTGRIGLLQPSSSLHNSIPTQHEFSFPKSAHSSQSKQARDGRAGEEPEPAMVTSDIVLLAAASVPAQDGQDHPPAGSKGSSMSVAEKSPTGKQPQASAGPADEDEEAKKQRRIERLRVQMKERWASGSMDHVVAKRQATLKKRKSAPLLTEEAQRTPKRRRVVPDRNLDVGQRSAQSEPGSTVAPSNAASSSLVSEDKTASGPSTRRLRRSSNPVVGNAHELWEYIRPHLVVYKKPELPPSRTVRRLIVLPWIRDIHWNHDLVDKHPFKDLRVKDITAMIIQLTGEEAPQPCNRCAKGRGPFKGCVMVSLEASEKDVATTVSCANCIYHFNGNLCSHRAWGRERQNKGGIAHDPGAEDHGVEEQDESDGDGDADIEDGDSLAPSQLAKGSKGRRWKESSARDVDAKAATRPDVPVIETAPSGRPYAMWPDDSGKLEMMRGALLPDGYELDYTMPGRPWICPVDVCRRVFMTQHILSFHFSRVHYASLLNDNGDATFTVMGQYDVKKVAGGGRFLSETPSLPVVTSRNARGDASLGQLQPRLPKYLERDAVSSPQLDPAPSPEEVVEVGDPDESEDEEAEDEEVEDGSSPPRRSGRLIHNVHQSGNGNGNGNGVAKLSRAPEGDNSSGLVGPRLRSRSSGRGLVNGTNPTGTSTALISAGQIQSAVEMLEMEEWEIAPGRIRAEASDTPDNVALSNAYLTANQSVPICSGLSFRVDVVRPGATHRLEAADGETTLVCSVAGGKVRVRIDGEPDFAIGPHGLFKVRPGAACSVQNRLYVDAVLHVTSLAEFG